MQLLAALSVICACVGATLAQVDCIPKGFSAFSFDNIRFVPSRSYHDIDSGLTRYENVYDDEVRLFNFNTGDLYISTGSGDCFKYNVPDAKNIMTASAGAEKLVEFTVDGATVKGYNVTTGSLVVNALLTDSCQGSFISFKLDGLYALSYFHSNQADLTEEDKKGNQDLLDMLKEAECTAVPLSTLFN